MSLRWLLLVLTEGLVSLRAVLLRPTVTEMRLLHLSVVVCSNKIDMLDRRHPERELGQPALIRDRKVALVDDVHSDQDVTPSHLALCNPYTGECNRVREIDVYEIGFNLARAVHSMRLRHPGRDEAALVDYSLRDNAVCRSSVPDRNELLDGNAWIALLRIKCCAYPALIPKYAKEATSGYRREAE